MVADFLDALRGQAADALFPLEGELSAPGLQAAVTVTRDGFGTPSIEAASLEDLWFAQGLVTAGERLFQLDMTIRAATGRLSEVFGERTYDDDRFARTIGLHLAGAHAAAEWTPEDHAMHARFRDGVRAWLALAPVPPIEYQLLGTAPKLPTDPAAWAACFAYLAWGLSNNLEMELLRARIRDRLGEDAMHVLAPPTSGRHGLGSNNWVVTGKRSASGKPLLANDPHLLAVQPGVWMPFDLRAPGYEARGVALTFTPGIVLGASSHHAWGATNVTGDVQDLFVVTDADVIEAREEPVTVLGETEPRTHTVRETVHGPILDRLPVGSTASAFEDVEETVALRWVGRTSGLRPSTVVRVAQARGFEEFRRAVLEIDCPGQNFVYADVQGHIGLQVTGLHPIRLHGDGSVPRTDHGWDGWIPADEMPWMLDPPGGVIVTANDGLLHAALSDHLITTDFHAPDRALRIQELLAEHAVHDPRSFAAIQRDTVSLAARRTVPLLLGHTEPASERQQTALHLLAAWDHDLAAGSPAAALYEVWTETIARRTLAPRLGEDLFRAYLASPEAWKCSVLPALLREPAGWLDAATLRVALEDALDELGEPIPAWGELHRLVLAHPLAAVPGLGPLFVAVGEPMGGDEQTVAAAGLDTVAGRRAAVIASWRVVWDLADPASSAWSLPAGVSGSPVSPHWRDQATVYRDGLAAGPAIPPRRLRVTPG